MKTVYYRRFIVSIVAIGVVFGSYLQLNAQANPAVLSISDGSLRIESPANAHAMLVLPLLLDRPPAELLVEMQVRHLGGSTGASWAPGIYLYWDQYNWIAIRTRHNPDQYRLQWSQRGNVGRNTTVDVTPVMDEWNGLRLIWSDGNVRVFVSHDMKGWQQIATMPGFEGDSPWLLLGKGYVHAPRRPYLANTYDHPGAIGVSLIRGVRVVGDSEIIFEESFSGDHLDTDRWTALVDGDPDLDRKIEELERLR